VLPAELKPFLSGITVTNYISLIENQDKLFECAIQATYKKLEIQQKMDEKEMQKEILAKFYALADTDPKIQTCYEYLFDVARAIYLGDRTKTTTTKLEQIEGKDEQFLEFLLNPLRAQNMFIQFLASVMKLQKDEKVLEIITSQTPEHQVGAINIRAQTYAADAESNCLSTTTMFLRDGFYLMQPVTDVDATIALRTTPDKTTGFWNKFVGYCVTLPANDAIGAKLKGKTLDADTFSMLAAFIYTKYAEGDVATLKQKIFESFTGEAADPANIDKTIIPDNPGKIPVVGTIMLDAVLKVMRMEHVHFIVHLVATLGEPTVPAVAAPAAPAASAAAGPEVDPSAAADPSTASQDLTTDQKKEVEGVIVTIINDAAIKNKAEEIKKRLLSFNKRGQPSNRQLDSARFRYALTYIKDPQLLKEFIATTKKYFSGTKISEFPESANLRGINESMTYELDDKFKLKGTAAEGGAGAAERAPAAAVAEAKPAEEAKPATTTAAAGGAAAAATTTAPPESPTPAAQSGANAAAAAQPAATAVAPAAAGATAQQKAAKAKGLAEAQKRTGISASEVAATQRQAAENAALRAAAVAPAAAGANAQQIAAKAKGLEEAQQRTGISASEVAATQRQAAENNTPT
jgi:hypothetical protein